MNLVDLPVEALVARAAHAATTLKLLANEQRLLLLCRISQGEVSVNDLVNHLGNSQSSVSQHLARLRDGGLVATRRDGTAIYYRVADASVYQLIDMLCARFGSSNSDV